MPSLFFKSHHKKTTSRYFRVLQRFPRKPVHIIEKHTWALLQRSPYPSWPLLPSQTGHPSPLLHPTSFSLTELSLPAGCVYQLTIKVHGSVSLQLGLGSATAPLHGNSKTSFLCAQSCPTLYDPMDCNPPGSSVHGIFQARILGWIAISSSRGSSQPRDWTHVFCIGRQILYCWAIGEDPQ